LFGLPFTSVGGAGIEIVAGGDDGGGDDDG